MYSVFFLLLLLHCFIFTLVPLLCCVYRSSLYCNIPLDLCTLCLSCYYFYIVLSLYLYVLCCVSSNIPFRLVYSVFVLLLLLHCFIFILVLLLCCVYRSSLYCNIPSDLCICVCLVITSTFFLSLYLYCFYVKYLDHHFTVIYLQILLLLLLVLLLCCVSKSSLYCNIPSDLCTLCLSCYYFYIVLCYICTVVMLYIQIITLL